MKAKIALIALALAASMPAWADEDPIGDLSPDHRPERTQGPDDRRQPHRLCRVPLHLRPLAEEVRCRVGKENYQQLMNGEAVALTDKQGREYLVQIKRDFKGAL